MPEKGTFREKIIFIKCPICEGPGDHKLVIGAGIIDAYEWDQYLCVDNNCLSIFAIRRN